jgi:hypothetical protein
MRHVATIALLAGSVLATSACFRPEIRDCSVTCGAAADCPAGMSCEEGWCTGTGAGCDAGAPPTGHDDGAAERSDGESAEARSDIAGLDADADGSDAEEVPGDALQDYGGDALEEHQADALEEHQADGPSDAPPLACPALHYRNRARDICVPAHDLNGDGKADLLAVNATEHHALISDGERFIFAKWLDGRFHDVGGAYTADVTGDGYADGIDFGVTFAAVVSRGGTGFGNTRDDYSVWSEEGLLGTRGTFVADLDGDGRSDVLAVFEGEMTLARSTGTSFDAPVPWLRGDFTDHLAAFSADADGDGMADVIAIRPRSVDVALSTGTALAPLVPWLGSKFVGREGTFFADVDGDGRSDGIRLESDGAWIVRSTGMGFAAEERWYEGRLQGPSETFAADADGDGRHDIVAVNPSGVRVALSTGSGFMPPTTWYTGQFRADVNMTVAPEPSASHAVARPTTVGVFRGVGDWGEWLLRSSNTVGDPDVTVSFATTYDIPVVGDWDGDGTFTIGIFRPARSAVNPGEFALWFLRNSNSPGGTDIPEFVYGAEFDIPVVGDWDGDGQTTVGVYRPPATKGNQSDEGEWFLRNSNSEGMADAIFYFGRTEDAPVAGDWDGDSITTVGLFRRADGQWLLRNRNDAGPPHLVFAYGERDDLPIAGDWNGNGTTTIGVFRPAETRLNPSALAEWRLRNTHTSGPPDISFHFGAAGDRPVTGRWLP